LKYSGSFADFKKMNILMQSPDMEKVNPEDHLAKISQWHKQGLDTGQILRCLKEQNIPENMVDEAMQQWNKIRSAKRRNLGFIYCGIGTGLLVFSFLISVLLFYSDHNISWALYGFTFIGLCITFKGMITIFGW
jgi:hypothetical protein